MNKSDLEWKQRYALQAAANILGSLANGDKIKAKGKLHKQNLAEHSAILRGMLHKIENPELTIWQSFEQVFKGLGM